MMPIIMGVLNINSDSFFKNSRIELEGADEKIITMIEAGANIIDVGGVSSRPGSESVSSQEELSRVKGIIDLIHKKRYYERVEFSLDSYSPLCLDYALFHGFKIVNDITGLKDDDVCKVAQKHKARVCIMHMKGSPQDMQKDPQYDDVIYEVNAFFGQRIEKAKKYNIDDIILDVGIGFGKRLEHNLSLIKNLGSFLHFGYPLLVGASRKSMIDMISASSIEERLPGTLVVHLESFKNGANIIRCHDVKEHIQAFRVYEALRESR